MKLEHVSIRNFRHIKELEIPLMDDLGRPRDLIVLVGPNGSGKTTVVDAIGTALATITELPYVRPGFELSPRATVRRGALQAEAVLSVAFEEAEIDAVRELHARAEEPFRLEKLSRVELKWTFPPPPGKRERTRWGWTECSPKDAWRAFKGRKLVGRLLSTGRTKRADFREVGGIFAYDQQRTLLAKRIPRDVWEVMSATREDSSNAADDERQTTDPKTILISLAVQSKFPPGDPDQAELFSSVKHAYSRICAPHKLVDVVRDEGGLDVEFEVGHRRYRYDGLSSGEQVVLLLLIEFVTWEIHKSIVLIDEIELHQHPVWQKRLLQYLPRLGDDNQFIVTTHSPYVRDAVPPEAVISLGELE